MAEKAYDYYSSNSYAGITYGKTASVLLTLESIIGEDTMAKAMHTYFMKYRFTHPDERRFPEDDRGSFRQRSALVFQPGDLRLAGHGLRGVRSRFLSRELVRR